MLGLGPSVYTWINNHHADFETKDEHQYWTINAGAFVFAAADIWFDMHTKEYLENQKAWELKEGVVTNPDRTERRRAWMKAHPTKTVIMAQSDPEIPNSYAFPLEKAFVELNATYFDCGLAYMIAAALLCFIERGKGQLLGDEEIGIYGGDFRAPNKQMYEGGQGCAEFWVGYAKGLGVNISLPSTTTLLNMYERDSGRLYGYHEPIQFDATDDGRAKFIGPDYD